MFYIYIISYNQILVDENKKISKGPVIFEINPRFSSTVRFRDLLGFKDIQWSIEDMIGIPISDYKATSIGKKIYKGFNEFVQ